MKKIYLILAAVVASMSVSAKNFTMDLSQPTNPESFAFNADGMWTETWNDSDYMFFDVQKYSFSHILSGNSYGGTSWEGFTVSKATTGDYYSNMAKGGLAGVGTPYILAYYSEWWLMNEDNEDMMSSNQIIFNDGEAYYPQYVYLNNALVTYNDILNGNAFGAHAFHRGDKFEVWIQGITEDLDDVTDEKVIYRLADYTDEDSTKWYVNTEWAMVDLTSLGKVYGLAFTVVSTDQGMYGTNTATYFALDGLTISDGKEVKVQVATFENEVGGVNVAKADTCWQGADAPVLGWNTWKSGDFTFMSFYDNSYGTYYSAFTVTNETATTSTGSAEPYRSTSGGAYEGENFVVWNLNYYGLDTVTFDKQAVKGFFVNNTAYAVTSMKNGDSFAKKFGAEDWFKLTCIGVLNGVETGRVDVDLAKDGKYIAEWTYVDLSTLGEINGLTFNMSSSDNSYGYMNTPAYFAMDNFGAAKPEGYVAPEMKPFHESGTSIQNTEAAVKAVKVIRNGQVLIVRDGKIFSVMGQER
jgi:hypothetical protein